MRSKASSVLAAAGCGAVCLLFVFIAPVHARPCRTTLIPNGGKLSCSNCHINPRGGGLRNLFGNAVGPLVGESCNVFWSPQLAALDSDRDGRTNGEELQDPEGQWRFGLPQPGDRALVTNPGVVDALKPPFIRGDSNGDGSVNLSDGIATLLVLVESRPHSGCLAAEDANRDGKIDISDAIFTLVYLFSGGTALPAPFPGCGTLSAGLECKTFLPCD